MRELRLAIASTIGSPTSPDSLPPAKTSRLARTRSKPTVRATGSANERKPPETSRQLAPPARIVWTKVSAPAVRRTRSSRQRFSSRSSRPARSRVSLPQRTGEIQFALHRPLGDARHLFLETGIIGELVDAFLADDRRIHVRDEQPLPPRFLGLDDNVHAFESVQRPTGFLAFPCEAKIGGIALVDPVKEGRGGVDLAKQSERAVDQPVIEPSRCYQRCNRHDRPETSARRHRRADRERQVRAGTRPCSANWRRDRQRRQRTNLPRPQGAERSARRRGAAKGGTPALWTRDGALPCSAAEWAELAKLEIADVSKAGRTPILVGGTGLYLRTLLDGIAPVPAIDPEVRARVRGTEVEEIGRSSPASTRKRPSESSLLTPPASTGRWRSSFRLVASWPNGSSTRGRDRGAG